MSKLNFVFDSNILISALMTDWSATACAFGKAWDTGTVVFSQDTFDEFVEVMFRKKFDK